MLIFAPLSPNFSAGVESRHSRVCEQQYAQAIRAPQVLQRHARSYTVTIALSRRLAAARSPWISLRLSSIVFVETPADLRGITK